MLSFDHMRLGFIQKYLVDIFYFISVTLRYLYMSPPLIYILDSPLIDVVGDLLQSVQPLGLAGKPSTGLGLACPTSDMAGNTPN